MPQKFSQYQRMLQKMALSPQMKHSIQLLSMSVADLNEYIDTVLATNPFLEKEIRTQSAEKQKTDTPLRGGGAGLTGIEAQKEIAGKENPRDSLLSQLRSSGLTEKESEIAEYLVYEMDENGYITCEPEEAARDLVTERDAVERVLEVIQGLEPPGIGARDIRECLLLQLRRFGKENSLEYAIVENFLSDVAINDLPKIAKSLRREKSEVLRAVKNIRKLNPRPGSTVLAKSAERVVPDLTADIKNSKVRLELNRESVPRLRLYNPYADKLDVVKDAKARKFLKENMRAAKELLDNIKRREETMCRAADYILNVQKKALEKNSESRREIRTLTINDVAKALKLHPSTISRTVSNKYVVLNGKSFPLKFFLSHGIKRENGDIASKASVKNRILELVKNEDSAKPLRDGEIAEKLKEEGIALKRRTVAKYRESLRLLPVHLRKKKRDQ